MTKNSVAASRRTHELAGRLEAAAQQPWNEGFVPLLRHIAAVHDDLPLLGTARRPEDEAVRVGQAPHIGFATREIASIGEAGGLPHYAKLRAQDAAKGIAPAGTAAISSHASAMPSVPSVMLYGLGMLGPNGALPLHFTEVVSEQVVAKRDHGLLNFLNIFHHRSFLHVYRAWAQSQAAAGLDRTDQETFTPYVARLLGEEPGETHALALPHHARWAAAPHRGADARTPEGIEASLSYFFGVPVRLLEFQSHWFSITGEDECRLGMPRPSSILGEAALIGDSVADRQNKFVLEIGPLNLEQYLRFTPRSADEPASSTKGRDLPVLVEWIRAFVGFEYCWEAKLLIDERAAIPACLGGEGQLGWSTWIKDVDAPASTTPKTTVGLVFEPEQYVS